MTELSNFDKVREFHHAMDMNSGVWPPSKEEVALRTDLILEEWDEVCNELYPQELIPAGLNKPVWVDVALNKQKLAKELADLLYVVYGTADSFGIPIDEVFAEVHASNMSKLVDGKPVKREDGKVLKGPNYKPPDLSFVGN